MGQANNMGFMQWLQLMLLGLWLTGNINWHWFFVFAPVWVEGVLLSIHAVKIQVQMKRKREQRRKGK